FVSGHHAMLIGEELIEDARAYGIDRHEGRARAWVQQHLPELFVCPLDKCGRPLRDASGEPVAEENGWDWSKEWPKWQENFRALLWLIERRQKPPKEGAFGEETPSWVSRVVYRYLTYLRAGVPPDRVNGFSSWRTVVLPPGGFDPANRRWACLDQYWAHVF